MCVCAADAHLGVFHQRSSRGQYRLNYTAAQQACRGLGAGLATYSQLSHAQQVSGRNTDALCWSGLVSTGPTVCRGA